MLLEILSAWQLSIPEFGTVEARSIPFVVLTSNEERRLGDPIRRRSLYVRVEHPTPQREADIIASRTPEADADFHREMAGIALRSGTIRSRSRLCLGDDRLRQCAAVARRRSCDR